MALLKNHGSLISPFNGTIRNFDQPCLPKKNYGRLETHSSIKICYLNSRSIINKLDILNNYVTLVHTSTDIFLISETWLNAAVPDSLVCPNGYYILCCDRKSGHGGGS